MNKKMIKLMIAAIIILTANVGVFAFVKHFSPTFWICYAFAMAACGITIYVEIFAMASEKLIFRYSVSAVTYLYFIIAVIAAFAASNIFIFKPLAAFMTQLIVLSLYLVLLFAAVLNNTAIKEQQQVRGRDIANFEYIKSMMKKVMEKVPYGDPDRKMIEHAGDAVASGQVRSSELVQDLEKRMIAQIEELERAVSIGSRSEIAVLCSQIEASAEERKRILSQRERF